MDIPMSRRRPSVWSTPRQPANFEGHDAVPAEGPWNEGLETGFEADGTALRLYVVSAPRVEPNDAAHSAWESWRAKQFVNISIRGGPDATHL